MGIAIYLFHISQMTQNEKYKDEAFELIDAIYKKMSLKSPFFFDSGLLGIGCGIEYIIHNGFVDANRDEVLSEIDTVAKNIIDSRPIDNLSLKNGVCGIGYYLLVRLNNRTNNNDFMTVLKLKEYLIYLIDWIESLLLKTTLREDYDDTYFLLARLHNLNVFNHKVENLITFCLQKTVYFNSLMIDNYDLLGINLLKTLKQWI